MRNTFYKSLSLFTFLFCIACDAMPSKLPSSSSSSSSSQQSLPAGDLSACYKKVLNRGIIPASVLKDIILVIKNAPSEVVAPNSNYDVYSSVSAQLGPYKNEIHRRAVMVDILRTLGGFESSWDYSEGIDVTNGSSALNKCNEEAGIFQTSGNSMAFDNSLKVLFKSECSSYSGSTDCIKFIKCSKTNPDRKFVIEYTARLLRFTTRHHGPVLRKEINPWLRRDCVAAVEKILLQ